MGVGVVPGAVVCQDLATVRLVSSLYADYWTDAMQDAMTHGASRLIRGPSVSAPDLPHYWCSLLKAGTPVHVERIMPGILRISAKSTDGRFVRGITQEDMIGELPSKQTSDSGISTSPGDRKSSLSVTSGGAGVQHLDEPDTKQNQMNEGPFVPGKYGVGTPLCIYCPDPAYSQDARAAGISGTVVLQIVFEPDAHASDIQIAEPLGYGLDEFAVRAVRSWHFKAAVGPTGVAAPTTVRVEVNFRLK